MITIVFDFINNSPSEVLVIGTLAFVLVGFIMAYTRGYLDIEFGREGGKLLWFLVALLISAIYHFLR